MKTLRLRRATAFLAFGLVVGLQSVGDSLGHPGKVGQTDKGFMTDRLLEEDMRRGALPLGDRDRDREVREGEKARIDRPRANGRE